MDRASRWIVSGDTGVSSKTIWSVMNNVAPDHADVPHDPSDFGRCFRLLLLVPEWRKRLYQVAFFYPGWAPLVREWDALSALYIEELKNKNGMAPKLYARMQALREEGMLLAGWKQRGPGSWEGPARGHKVPLETVEAALKPLQAQDATRSKA
jgi:hypothetical protein